MKLSKHWPWLDAPLAEIGGADAVVAAIPIREGQAGAERNLGADDAVAAEEALLLAEHVHRAALAAAVAAGAAGEFGHDAARLHAAGQHVAVVAVGGDDLVALAEGGLDADDDGFLADVEVAEAADETHAIELAGLFLEAADEQHVAIGFEQLVLAHGLRLVGAFGSDVPAVTRCCGLSHAVLLRGPSHVASRVASGKSGSESRDCAMRYER